MGERGRTRIALEVTEDELERMAGQALSDIVAVAYHDNPSLEDGKVEIWSVAKLEALKAELTSTVDRAIELFRAIEANAPQPDGDDA